MPSVHDYAERSETNLEHRYNEIPLLNRTANETAKAIEDFRSDPLQSKGSGLHHRLVDEHSYRNIAEIAAQDASKALTQLRENGGNDPSPQDLRGIAALRDAVEGLPANGIEYTTTDPEMLARMEFHSAYRGDRIREDFTKTQGLEYLPKLEQFEKDTEGVRALADYAAQLSPGNAGRLIDSITAHYASDAPADRFQEKQREAAQRLWEATARIKANEARNP